MMMKARFTIILLIFSFISVFATKTPVDPGSGSLEDAVINASAGDTLVLQINQQYDVLDAMTIDKKLTIMAETIDTLPKLDDLPIVNNLFGVDETFLLADGCDLSLISLDLDGGTGLYIFQASPDTGKTISLTVNRCRMHNTTSNILHQVADLDAQQTKLQTLVIKNSFIYDNGAGHGIYTKNYDASTNEWLFENDTYWNIGQQFDWIRAFPSTETQKVTFNHLTGYKLSTSISDNKELFGNSDATGEAKLDITLKNSILSDQVSTNAASLLFNNTSGNHTITIKNLVLFNVQPVGNTGTVASSGIQEGVDPQFADPDNGDFTVGNSALYTAGDDGKILGAVYWDPNYVDCDIVGCSGGGGNAIHNTTVHRLPVDVYPNPFAGEVKFEFNLDRSQSVNIDIQDISGRTLMTIDKEIAAGSHQVTVNVSGLDKGVYIYNVSAGKDRATGRLIKSE